MPGAKKSKAAAPITVNQEILRAAGLVRTLNKPLKILGNGDLATALFVVADAVSGVGPGQDRGGGWNGLDPRGAERSEGRPGPRRGRTHAETVATEADGHRGGRRATRGGAGRGTAAGASTARLRACHGDRWRVVATPEGRPSAEERGEAGCGCRCLRGRARRRPRRPPETDPTEDAPAEPADD